MNKNNILNLWNILMNKNIKFALTIWLIHKMKSTDSPKPSNKKMIIKMILKHSKNKFRFLIEPDMSVIDFKSLHNLSKIIDQEGFELRDENNLGEILKDGEIVIGYENKCSLEMETKRLRTLPTSESDMKQNALLIGNDVTHPTDILRHSNDKNKKYNNQTDFHDTKRNRKKQMTHEIKKEPQNVVEQDKNLLIYQNVKKTTQKKRTTDSRATALKAAVAFRGKDQEACPTFEVIDTENVPMELEKTNSEKNPINRNIVASSFENNRISTNPTTKEIQKVNRLENDLYSTQNPQKKRVKQKMNQIQKSEETQKQDIDESNPQKKRVEQKNNQFLKLKETQKQDIDGANLKNIENIENLIAHENVHGSDVSVKWDDRIHTEKGKSMDYTGVDKQITSDEKRDPKNTNLLVKSEINQISTENIKKIAQPKVKFISDSCQKGKSNSSSSKLKNTRVKKETTQKINDPNTFAQTKINQETGIYKNSPKEIANSKISPIEPPCFNQSDELTIKNTPIPDMKEKKVKQISLQKRNRARKEYSTPDDFKSYTKIDGSVLQTNQNIDGHPQNMCPKNILAIKKKESSSSKDGSKKDYIKHKDPSCPGVRKTSILDPLSPKYILNELSRNSRTSKNEKNDKFSGSNNIIKDGSQKNKILSEQSEKILNVYSDVNSFQIESTNIYDKFQHGSERQNDTQKNMDINKRKPKPQRIKQSQKIKNSKRSTNESQISHIKEKQPSKNQIDEMDRNNENKEPLLKDHNPKHTTIEKNCPEKRGQSIGLQDNRTEGKVLKKTKNESETRKDFIHKNDAIDKNRIDASKDTVPDKTLASKPNIDHIAKYNLDNTLSTENKSTKNGSLDDLISSLQKSLSQQPEKTSDSINDNNPTETHSPDEPRESKEKSFLDPKNQHMTLDDFL